MSSSSLRFAYDPLLPSVLNGNDEHAQGSANNDGRGDGAAADRVNAAVVAFEYAATGPLGDDLEDCEDVERRLAQQEEAEHNLADWEKMMVMEKDWKSEGGNVCVDQTPLQNQLKKNKESLAVKLKLRRPMTALVEQGIMPQYKTSPSLHEQRTKLERAQMGDKLRQKIASRPDRQELVHRHILEDVRPDVDPSLCSKQRQLKRAKLADSLAGQLSHRPGPLELIQKNILHTDDPVEQLVKEGTIAFTPTAEGAPNRPGLLAFDDDSSDTATSPLAGEFDPSPLPADINSDSSTSNVPALLSQGSDTGAPSHGGGCPGEVTPLQTTFQFPHKSSRSESLGDITNSNGRIASLSHIDLLRSESYGGSGTNLTARDGFCGGSGNNLAAVGESLSGSGTNLAIVTTTTSSSSTAFGVNSLSELSTGPHLQREFPGKDRKKANKVKKPSVAQAKPRTIKFHEYKGPEKETPRRKMDDKKGEKKPETQYDLLLKQQQLFLQWQLENQNKYPQILLPAASRSSMMSVSSTISSTNTSLIGSSSASLNSSSQTSSSAPSPASSVPGTPRSNTPIRSLLLTPQDVNHATSLLNKLEEMKVTELKMELKKRNLSVSGSKPTLVERLRGVLEGVVAAGRQQFQQPYKQIQLISGGLIILKPSPNSQLLTKTEPNQQQLDNQMVTAIGATSPQVRGDRIPPPPPPPPPNNVNNNLQQVNNQLPDNMRLKEDIVDNRATPMHEGTPDSLMEADNTNMTSPSHPNSLNNGHFSCLASPQHGGGSILAPYDSPYADSPLDKELEELLANSNNDDRNNGNSHGGMFDRENPNNHQMMELDFNFKLMEDSQMATRCEEPMMSQPSPSASSAPVIPAPPPPPPPPPPPGLTITASTVNHPTPTIGRAHHQLQQQQPGTPGGVGDKVSRIFIQSLSEGVIQPAGHQPSFQFVPPPTKSNHQILLAKQQLESQLSGGPHAGGAGGNGGAAGNGNNIGGGSVKAGPKGQFIWPPVSVQSSQGTVSIRAKANANSGPSDQAEQRMSSTPVAQLAAVFSCPSNVKAANGQKPVTLGQPSKSVIGMTSLTITTSVVTTTVTSSPAMTPSSSQSSILSPCSSTSSISSQLNPLEYQLPKEPIPAAELGLVFTANKPLQPPSQATTANQLKLEPQFVSVVANGGGNGMPNNLVTPAAAAPGNLYDLPLSQLPATLPQAPEKQAVVSQENTPENMLRMTENIIKKQQEQIEQLKRDLERSQQQLRVHQNSSQQLEQNGGQQPNVNNVSAGNHHLAKQLIAQQLHRKQLANSMQQLQELQQLQNQQLEQLQSSQQQLHHSGDADPKLTMAVRQADERAKQTLESSDHSSMDDVIEIILRNGDHSAFMGSDASSGSCGPPPPPPPPNQTGLNRPPPMEMASQLEELTDLSFDLSQLPDTSSWSQSLPQDGEDMEVDNQGVADWLDSLIPNGTHPSTNGLNGTQQNSNCFSEPLNGFASGGLDGLTASLHFSQADLNAHNSPRNLK